MNHRVAVPTGEIGTAIELVKNGLLRSLQRHGGGSFVSAHEVLGVLEEERIELIEAIHDNDEEQTIKELTDVAVTALFGIASLRANAAETKRMQDEKFRQKY